MQTEKKKILYVITKSNWGGAQRYVYDLATNLPKKEFEVKVVLGGEGELKKKLEEAGIAVTTVQTLGRDIGIFRDITSLCTLLKIFKNEKPDIVHLNSSKAGGLGALAARIYNFLVKFSSFSRASRTALHATRIIFTAHGWAWNEERPEWQRWMIEVFSWLTIILSHTTIVVSDYDRRQAQRMPFVKNKIIRVHNGVSVIQCAAKKTARETLLGEKAQEFSKALWIGTIAELHKNKGLEFGMQAFRKIVSKKEHFDVVWVVIGEGEERETLEKSIVTAGLGNKVFLVGHKDHAAALMRAFDIFLLPSLKEGLPYVILEAGFAGIPVIASAVGGIPEVIEDMESGILVKPRSPDELVLAAEFLMSNKEKRPEFGVRIKEKIGNAFSTGAMLAQTAGLYRV